MLLNSVINIHVVEPGIEALACACEIRLRLIGSYGACHHFKEFISASRSHVSLEYIHYAANQNVLSLKAGPAWPTSLKTVPARPKIRPGQEDVKSRLRSPWMQHEPNMPARPITVNEVQNLFANLALSKISNRITSFTNDTYYLIHFN